MTTYRRPVRACVHPETYKYFLSREEVIGAWRALADRYGGIRVCEAVGTMEVESPVLLARATRSGNPVTLIRKRGCSTADVAEFHQFVGYREELG